MVTDLRACGTYVVVEELCGFDCMRRYVYDSSTGRLVASRAGGGIVWTLCGDGYRSNWSTQPPGFMFPRRQDCTALNARDLPLADGGTEPVPRGSR